MAGLPAIDFRNIRPLDGDKRKGFEELVCQLARREKDVGTKEFRRIEGSGGDSGIEAYWLLEDGTERGYQAKYFLATKEIDWSQIDKSVKTILEKHPKLTIYFIAISCDLTDRSGTVGKGKTGWQHWDNHKSKWKRWAEAKRLNVEFIPWTKSVLIDKLTTNTENHGLILWWFNIRILDHVWFQNHFERVKADLGERFQPEDHVEVELSNALEGLSRSTAYLDFLSNWFNSIPPLDDLPAYMNKLNSPFDQKAIQDISDRCDDLRRIGQSISYYKEEPFPLTDWHHSIKAAADGISPVLQWLNAQNIKRDNVLYYYKHDALKCLHAIDSHLARTPIHLQSDQHDIRVESDFWRVLIVSGESGSGKSHLFASFIASALSKNKPALLLLGQYFPGQEIRREFLNCLDLTNYEFEVILQALNAAGEVAQRRLIILVDALNESQELRVWPDQVAGFITDILKYEWLSIGVSLRQEYEKNLMPANTRNNAAITICYGIQTPEEQEQAAVQYFEKRGITRPAVPWLAPEFSNFLFLKTCCDALHELGLREFPRGLRGSLQVIEFYLSSVESKLKKRFPLVEIPEQAIRNTVIQIARNMAAARTDYISFQKARDICEIEFGFRGPNANTTWPIVLASEGVLRQDHIFDSRSADPLADKKNVYRFTYQRFSNHLIVRALLENIDDIDAAFADGGFLNFLIDNDGTSAWHSLWSALSVQIPEKFIGKELIDVLVEKNCNYRYGYLIDDAFIESILWRDNNAFSKRTLDLFNVLLPTEWHDPRIEILIRLATLRDHPWNAEIVDRTLQRKPMPERDAFWTVHINNITRDEQHALWELIHWCLNANLKLAETETLRLAAITLAWMFTSSNKALRDSSTKALIAVLLNRPELIPIVLDRFRNVDDLYVMERVCAAVLGAVTRISDCGYIKASALAVYRTVFNRETPPLHITLRDYSRAIIEYAFKLNCLDKSIDIEKCRPPYRSAWPLMDSTNEEIDQIAEQAGGKQILSSAMRPFGDFGNYVINHRSRHFTNVPLKEPRPINNDDREEKFRKQIIRWDREKQKAISELEIAIKNIIPILRFYKTGNIKNKLVLSHQKKSIDVVKKKEAAVLDLLNDDERALYDVLMIPVLFPDRVPIEERILPEFDSMLAKRWITKKAYEYGWTDKLFPNDGRYYERSDSQPKIERIGKKYQWLALFEFMARLSDNLWTIGGWPERAMVYDHPATDWFVRDIEPSILTDVKNQKEEKRWWQSVSFELSPIEDNRILMWPFEKDFLNTPYWMDVISPDGTQWLLLYGFFNVHEKKTEEIRSMHSLRRHMFIRITSILVESDKIDSAISKLKGRRLADPSGHEKIEWTDGPFLCEYPWRNTWKSVSGDFDIDHYGNFAGIKYLRPVARHAWEYHLDLSLKDGSSLCIPHPLIGKKLGLKPNLDCLGEFIDSKGRKIFLDPTYGQSDSSVALIHKEEFFDFLKKENLECIWIVAGEKSSSPTSNAYSCRSLAAVYRWTGKKWIGNKWNNDTKRLNSLDTR